MIHRVSNVEAFRQWEADQDAELEPLLAKLQGRFEPSAAMVAGTAFHKALELACSGVDLDSVEANGHRFVFPADLEIEVTPIRELRASKTYMVDGEPITISGQVDAIEGQRIEDHKTTGRFDPERYLEGYQWRLYLDIFGAQWFRWNVFEIIEVDGDYDGPTYEVKATHRLEQFAYPTLHADCQALVERFARFARTYGELELA